MTTQAQMIETGKPVKVNIFDGHVCGQEGKVIAQGENSAGECVYLVEMEDQQPEGDKLIGTEQLRHGKKWVLSLYPEEVAPL
jgi:hypothetical protein